MWDDPGEPERSCLLLSQDYKILRRHTIFSMFCIFTFFSLCY